MSIAPGHAIQIRLNDPSIIYCQTIARHKDDANMFSDVDTEWKQLGDGKLAGAVAGYAGGGAFQVESFYATEMDGELTSLWIDNEDKISGDEVSFDDLPENIVAECEKCLDCIWEWNDNDVWGDSDEVVLIQSMCGDLTKDGDMYLHSTGAESFVKIVCEEAGLTAAPK